MWHILSCPVVYSLSKDLHMSGPIDLQTRCCWIGASIHTPDVLW